MTAPKAWTAAKTLTAHEVLRAREAFCAFDGGSGELELRLVRSVLQRLAIYPSEETLFTLIGTHDPAGRGTLSQPNFLALLTDCRNMTHQAPPSDTMTLDAFVALGGNKDQSGVVSTDRLREAVRDDFALPVDIDRLIREADADGSGFIDYDEFSAMVH
jgi:calmodulin